MGKNGRGRDRRGGKEDRGEKGTRGGAPNQICLRVPSSGVRRILLWGSARPAGPKAG